jgi:hypothetical protein
MYVTDELNKRLGFDNVIYTRVSDPRSFSDYIWHSDKFIDWNEIKKIRFKNARSGSKADGWNVYSSYYSSDIVTDLDGDENVVYWSSSRSEDISAGMFDMLTKHMPDATIIREPVNRHKRLVREFPNAINVYTALAQIKKSLRDKVVESDHLAYSIKNVQQINSLSIIKKYSGIKSFDDPELNTLVEIFDGKQEMSQPAKDLLALSDTSWIKQLPVSRTRYIVANYKLVTHISVWSLGQPEAIDVVRYINLKYKERQGK